MKRLPVTEQKALLARLTGLVNGSSDSETVQAQEPLARFFAEWDASHSLSVGERPTRERTYAGNPRLR